MHPYISHYINVSFPAASNGSIESAAALRTSPPSIPLETQDPAPRREAGQRSKQDAQASKNTTPTLRRPAGVSAVAHPPANTSRNLGSGPHNTSGPVSPACNIQQTPVTQSRTKKAKTSKDTVVLQRLIILLRLRNVGSQMPPPTVPAKRTEPTQDDQLFEDSSLTEPDTPIEDSPPRKLQKPLKTKTVPPPSSRKSQRTTS